jgi:hypothetical protein
MERGEWGGSVAWRDAWKEGDGGLVPTGGRRLDRPRTGHNTVRTRERRASDTWAPDSRGRERERRGAGMHGPARGKDVWAEPGGTRNFLIYSIKFQTILNYFDQKVDLPYSKKYK